MAPNSNIRISPIKKLVLFNCAFARLEILAMGRRLGSILKRGLGNRLHSAIHYLLNFNKDYFQPSVMWCMTNFPAFRNYKFGYLFSKLYDLFTSVSWGTTLRALVASLTVSCSVSLFDELMVMGVGSLLLIGGYMFLVSPSTNPQATIMMLGSGYITLERTAYGKLSEKLDVHSYGVLLLEIVSKMPNRGMQTSKDMVDPFKRVYTSAV
ncbi:hypothetical protein R6Q59_010311 [Mikania micrantha]